MLWVATQIDAMDRALRQAWAGQPTALFVEGESGTGKTSLLDELTRRARGFHITAAEPMESDGAPPAYDLLNKLGVGIGSGEENTPTTTFVAAQQLREHLDQLPAGPILLHLDDLQWADPESIESIRWLLSRAEGDRLLIAVGFRPTTGRIARALAHLAQSAPESLHISLRGLTEPQVSALVAAHRPGLSDVAVARLRELTDGNPLYLSAMLDEFDIETLSRSNSMLPAPTVFADIIGQRLERLTRPARVLVEALVVIGTGWTPVTDVVAVARFSTGATRAVDELQQVGLVRTRVEPFLTIRPEHALVRAAVYQQTPSDLRRVLHRRAAEITEPPTSLDHRLAAAQAHDSALADDLESWAGALHARRDHRRAAHYYRAAVVVTASRADRERRRLEALWDEALAGESPESMRDDPPSHVLDRPRARVIAAFVLLRAGDARQALRELDDLHGPELRRADPVVKYRIGVLTAYLRMLLGASTDSVTSALATIEGLPVTDPALAPIESPTQGYMAARLYGSGILAFLRDMPENPLDVPAEQAGLLIWRGLFRISSLQVRAAIADFDASVTIAGRAGNTVAHQIHLGQARWLAGDWPLAKVAFDAGIDGSLGASTWLPDFENTLLDNSQGRFAATDRQLQVALDRSRVMPWPENKLFLLIALAVRCHAAGAPGDQIDLLGEEFADLDALLDITIAEDSLILMHAAQVAIWTGRLETFDNCVTKMRDAVEVGTSHWTVLSWLDGLAAAQRGDVSAAKLHLRKAAEEPSNELPFYRAHMWADLAAALAVDGDAGAETCLDAALQIYRQLGATPYIERLQSVPDPARQTGRQPLAAQESPVFRPVMTAREQDVLALVVTGLSYAQIARDLFVTQSTVGFHLSKLYAKFDVSSRHELTALIRQHPELLISPATTVALPG